MLLGTAHGSGTVWHWLGGAVPVLENALLFGGVGLLVLVLASRVLTSLLSFVASWPIFPLAIRRRGRPAVQIRPFDDSAVDPHLGNELALQTQARISGGREGGRHLYLVTGEQSPGTALATVEAVPQVQALAVALALLRYPWRQQLTVTGSLIPAGTAGTVALVASIARNSELIDTADFWPSDSTAGPIPADVANRVVAVAAAGWIQHHVVDLTPGPSARELFYSADARSWALFRAGSELSRMSCQREAADKFEEALAIDPNNIGALVDLAHLRRLAGYFDGACGLVRAALRLIETRNAELHQPLHDDADWFRANLVDATVQSEWAKDPDCQAPDDHRRQAFEAAQQLSQEAIIVRVALERDAGRAELERASSGARPGIAARWRAFGRGTLRYLYQLTWPSTGEPGTVTGLGRRARARRAWERCHADRVLDFHVLLQTTLEPGALLIVVANAGAPFHQVETSDERRVRTQGISTDRLLGDAGEQLLKAADQIEVSPIIDYVERLRLKSPRVEYNLACYYGRAASAEADEQRRRDLIDTALEHLRLSIHRSPPLERAGLLDYSRRDHDLAAVHRARAAQLRELEQFVPRLRPRTLTARHH